MGAHPEEGPPKPPSLFLRQRVATEPLNRIFLLNPPLSPDFSRTEARNSDEGKRNAQRDGAQATRRGTGSATTNSEAGTLRVKARNALGAPRGSPKQGA